MKVFFSYEILKFPTKSNKTAVGINNVLGEYAVEDYHVTQIIKQM